MMDPAKVQGWLDDAPGRLRPLWIFRGVTGEEVCHGQVARDLHVEQGGDERARLAWAQGGLYGRELRPPMSDAMLLDGQLRVAVFGGEYDVLPFNIENAQAVEIPEAMGMPAGDDEAEALVAYPFGFGDI